MTPPIAAAPIGRQLRAGQVVARINVLGPLEMFDGNRDPMQLPTGIQRAAAVCLAERLRTRQSASPSYLIDACWPQTLAGTPESEVRSAKSLQTPLSRLWNGFGVPVAGHAYLLADGRGDPMPADFSDVTEFAEYASNAPDSLQDAEQFAACRDALLLWRADPYTSHEKYLHVDVFGDLRARFSSLLSLYLGSLAQEPTDNLGELRFWESRVDTFLGSRFSFPDRVRCIIRDVEQQSLEVAPLPTSRRHRGDVDVEDGATSTEAPSRQTMDIARRQIVLDMVDALTNGSTDDVFLVGARLRSMSDVVREVLRAVREVRVDPRAERPARRLVIWALDPDQMTECVLPGEKSHEKQSARNAAYADYTRAIKNLLAEAAQDALHAWNVTFEFVYYQGPPIFYCYLLGRSKLYWGPFTWDARDSDWVGPAKQCVRVSSGDAHFDLLRSWFTNRIELYEAEAQTGSSRAVAR